MRGVEPFVGCQLSPTSLAAQYAVVLPFASVEFKQPPHQQAGSCQARRCCLLHLSLGHPTTSRSLHTLGGLVLTSKHHWQQLWC